MIREVKSGFQVLVGSAPTLWPSLLMGACGAILAYANAAPYSVIAIKESSGNLEKVMQMIREVKHGFQVLVGSAPTLWPSLLMGASGAILAYANAAPYSVIAIWEAYRTREEAAGLDWQNRIGRPAALVTTKYGVPGLKYAMDLNGYYGGPPRLPLVVPTPEAKKEIEEAFKDLKG